MVEGEIDALSIIDLGFEAIALGSTSNVDLLLRVLQDQPEAGRNEAYASCTTVCETSAESPTFAQTSLVLSLDNDRAGQEATDKLEEGLRELDFPFFRADGLYGDFKDANEALTHSR